MTLTQAFNPTDPAYHNATAGQYWLMKSVDQEPAWPVFICPEEIVWEYFKSATNRPQAARRTDGTFPKAVGKSQQLLPVLYLGNLRMCWAKRIHLEQLDFAAAVIEKDSNPNVVLAHAYAELIEQYGESDAQYWSSRLLAKRLTEEESGDGSEEAVVPALAQDARIAKSTEPGLSRRPYSGDRSDEEDLRSHALTKKEEVLKCGAIHVLAHRFDIPALQALVISKLRVLQPFPEREFLAMTQLAFGTGLGGRDGLDILVVDYMVDHFYELMKTAIDQVKDLLMAKQQLRSQVFAIMARINEPPRSIKEEAEAEAVTGGNVAIAEGVVADENPPPSVAYLTGLQTEATTERGIEIFEDTENDRSSPLFSDIPKAPMSEPSTG
ncbi:MAG: hypothetical protein Q9186_002660 [Xanthomendoza sp. 1 TL-2023]